MRYALFLGLLMLLIPFLHAETCGHDTSRQDHFEFDVSGLGIEVAGPSQWARMYDTSATILVTNHTKKTITGLAVNMEFFDKAGGALLNLAVFAHNAGNSAFKRPAASFGIGSEMNTRFRLPPGESSRLLAHSMFRVEKCIASAKVTYLDLGFDGATLSHFEAPGWHLDPSVIDVQEAMLRESLHSKRKGFERDTVSVSADGHVQSLTHTEHAAYAVLPASDNGSPSRSTFDILVCYSVVNHRCRGLSNAGEGKVIVIELPPERTTGDVLIGGWPPLR